MDNMHNCEWSYFVFIQNVNRLYFCCLNDLSCHPKFMQLVISVIFHIFNFLHQNFYLFQILTLCLCQFQASLLSRFLIVGIFRWVKLGLMDFYCNKHDTFLPTTLFILFFEELWFSVCMVPDCWDFLSSEVSITDYLLQKDWHFFALKTLTCFLAGYQFCVCLNSDYRNLLTSEICINRLLVSGMACKIRQLHPNP